MTEESTDNPTPNPTLQELADRRFSRRVLLGGGLAVAAAGSSPGRANGNSGPLPSGRTPGHPGQSPPGTSLLGFEAVAPGTADAVVVAGVTPPRSSSPGARRCSPPARRGRRTDPTPPPNRPSSRDGPRRHALLPRRARPAGSGLLVLNHEYIDQTLLFADGPHADDAGEGAQGVGRPRCDRGGRGAGRRGLAGSGLAAQPADHRHDADGVLRSRPAEPPGAGRQQPADGHAQQLRPRIHAVGHVPHLRGELERLLRNRGTDLADDRPSSATA